MALSGCFAIIYDQAVYCLPEWVKVAIPNRGFYDTLRVASVINVSKAYHKNQIRFVLELC